MAPDKTNLLLEVISMSIITLIVAQDALGVLGVLPGEVGFMRPHLGDKQRDGGQGEENQRTRWASTHSLL